MMDSIFSIEFTTEVAGDFDNNMLPTLDFNMWMEPDGQLSYVFYRKPITTPFCIRATTASPEDQKLAILSQEVIRRMRHIRVGIKDEQEIRNSTLEEFINMMEIL